MLQLKEKLSQYWQCIQLDLFPWLAESIGPLSGNHQRLVTVLEMVRVEEFIQSTHGYVGRPSDDRAAIARAFVAKAIYNLPTTRHLLDRLQNDKVLRRICGWERVSDISEEWTFSRAFAEFAESQFADRVHAALIKEYHAEQLVGHISRDSTAIEAREKAIKKEKPGEKPPKKRGRPKKGEQRPPPEPSRLEQQLNMSLDEMLSSLPKDCDIGTKVNSKGYKESWKGYKLHLDTADGGIPISAVLTSASVHDSQVALPLTHITAQRVQSLYDVMDSAYDASIIREHSKKFGHIPLIDYNKRNGRETRSFMPHEAERYKERTVAERMNARIKDEFGARMIRVRGHAKIMSHLMFGVIVLTVDQLIRLAM